MKSLALDTSRKSFSIALLKRREIVAELTSAQYLLSLKSKSAAAERVADSPRTDASALLIPMISEILERQSWTFDDLELISVCHGPGSFTGLRVGVVAAKTLAYATHLSLIGVDSMRVAAAQTLQNTQKDRGFSSIVATTNAQRGQLLATRFEWNDGETAIDTGQKLGLVTPDQLLPLLNNADLLTGEGLVRTASVFRNALAERPGSGFQIAPESCWLTSASTVGLMGAADFERGHRSDHWTLSPVYFRPSSAEEVAKKRQAEIKNG